jgi:hypothetical protein
MQDLQIAVLKTNVTKQGKSVAKFRLRVVFEGKT